MKIVIPGGSGQVGTVLARAFIAEGHEVVVLSRTVATRPWRVVAWDGESAGEWTSEIDGADVVINLAGRSVNCRYNAKNRAEMMRSRTHSTRAVGEAIALAKRPPRVWLQSSTATIYAHRFDAANDEGSGIIGGDEPGVPDTWRFSIEVAKAWEAEATATKLPSTRIVLMRSAMTMSPDRGGIFDTLLRLVRFGLGGTNGDGRQFISWIHDFDFIEALRFAIARDDLHGAINFAAPEPLPNREFLATLRKAWGARVGLPATRLMLEVGAVLMGTETELILKSRRVAPGRLLEAGYAFRFPTWLSAARDLCERWPSNR